MVDNLDKLNSSPWSGHSALMGKVARDWQDQEAVPANFGSEIQKARTGYKNFVGEGIALGRRPELVGGGLVRSHGDWSQVISLRRKGTTVSCDTRILGGSDFVERILSEAEKRKKRHYGSFPARVICRHSLRAFPKVMV